MCDAAKDGVYAAAERDKVCSLAGERLTRAKNETIFDSRTTTLFSFL